MYNSKLASAFALLAFTTAQHVTVPTTCTGNFTGGTDEVLYTVPYTYDQVMSIIGSYKNLTWSGNPDDTVKLNGTDNTVGTARTYDTAGAHVIETILTYSKPPSPGPYDEVHNTAVLSVGALSFYIPYDGTTVTSYCDGKAAQFNFTAQYCANNATAAGAILHMLHLADAVTVGTFLGGQNFTSCAALGASGASAPPTAPSTTAGSTATSGAPAASSSVVPATGAAATMYTAGIGAGALALGAALLAV
ncbi:hypothetical protein LTR09_002726 [Extremus antarcticus]|uniref:Uncharacterized protein n=1 Tax=Extremus antarcticus TaxID=702011 RepID=A0AAJ0GEY7_9PEZI|nr:hypothetical protein LTR09_002726 [Extremus antarcticus]